MSHGRLLRFDSLADGIAAEDAFLRKAESNGHDTIESLNGWYVVPASANWLNVVLRTKAELESLP